MQAYSFVTVICITKKSLSTFLRDIRSCYFQQEQGKGLWKAVSSSQWNCVRVREKFSSWKPKEIYCSYFCQSFNTYFNKGFILDIYLSALPSHAHKQNVTKLSVLCIGSTRTTESMEQRSIIRHFKISRETESVLCRIATWDFFGKAFAYFTTFIRIACVAVVERGRGRGLREREKTRLPRRLFTDHYGAAQETRTKFLRQNQGQNSVTVLRNSKQYRLNLKRSFEMDGCKSGKEAPRILSKTPRGPVNRQEGRLGTRKMQA